LLIHHGLQDFVCVQEFSLNNVNFVAANVNERGKSTETSASEVVNTNSCVVSLALLYFASLFGKSFIWLSLNFSCLFSG